MVTETPCQKSKCPSDAAISALVTGNDSSTTLAEHVGECIGCQERLESAATTGAKHLSSIIRGLDKIDPPNQSAFWPALNAAELSITRDFSSSDTDPEDRENIDLSFLRPSPVPGRIGRLGEFEIVKAIGKGGMGVVLHAFDPNLQRDVAIKVLDPHLATNAVARQRFCREARSAAAVTHENVVTVHQVDEDATSGLPFLVMQMVVGESLETKLRRQGQLTIAEAVNLGVQAAAGLAAAHAGGLIHRDIKPGNILIENETGRAKLTDFGLARATEDLKLTKTGMVAGTPLYMAPEQANGLEPDQRADLFSLGSVLYESLAGRPAFEANTPLAVLRRIADHSHESLRKINPSVPPWLDDVIEGLLKKDPNQRIATAREVVERLASHAECVIPPLVGISGDKCAIVKAASTAIKTYPPLRRIAATFLVGTFGLGAAAGGFGTWLVAPTKERERIVTIEKEVPVANAAGTPKADPGPDPLKVYSAQIGSVWSVFPDEDGAKLAAGYDSGRVQIWDLKTGISTGFDVHKGPVWSANYSPDGKMLVTASDDNFVYVRDVTTGNATPFEHPNAVRTAAMHRDGKHVVTGDRSGIVHVWDLEGFDPPRQFTHGAAINAIAISPDLKGGGIASAGTDGRVVLWDYPSENEKPRNELKGGHLGPVYGLAYNHDGSLIATGGWDGKIVIWNSKDASIIKTFKANEEGIGAIDFSPCCKYLATAGQDGLVKIWDLVSDDTETPVKLLATFSRHKGSVNTVHFFADGKQLASGGRDGKVMTWDIGAICNHP